MLQRKKLTVIAIMLALAAAPAFAAEDEHSQHHPAAAAMPASRTGDMQGGPMAGMADGMPMMRMMQGHVEGRLASMSRG